MQPNPVLHPKSIGLLALLLIAGCSSGTNPRAGHIYVNHPGVFTRERLINRRLDEQAWLERQLTNDAGFSIQGGMSTLDFTGMAASIKGASGATGATGSSATPAANSADAATAAADQYKAVAPRTGASNQLTSIQSLDDKLAFRNAIQAALREQELDDTHDLGGMALYTLKFDISVLPGENNPSFGQVSLKFGQPGRITTNEFNAWIKSLNHQLLEECMSLERRYYMSYLSDEERDQLFALAIASKQQALAQMKTYEHDRDLGRVMNGMLSMQPEQMQEEFEEAQKKLAAAPARMNAPAGASDIDAEAFEVNGPLKIFGLTNFLELRTGTNKYCRLFQWSVRVADFVGSPSMDAAQELSSLTADVAKLWQADEVEADLRKALTAEQISARTNAPMVRDIRRLLQNGRSDTLSAVRKVETLSQEWSALDLLFADIKADAPGTNGAKGLAYLIQQRYQEALTGIVEITADDQGVGVDTNLFFVCTAVAARSTNAPAVAIATNRPAVVDKNAKPAVPPRTNAPAPATAKPSVAAIVPTTDRAFENFTNRLQVMLGAAKPRVAVVEPKEYAQNISDVAAWDKVVSLAASYSALMPQAKSSLGVDSSYRKHSQQMMDTIKRQPLLVGFINGYEDFGWILGPKFALQDDTGMFSHPSVTWSHTPIQYSVEASVIVPGWWPQMTLVATNGWLDKSRGHKYVSDTNTFTVRLPQDYAAITRALISQSGADRSLLQPSILPRWDPDPTRQRIVVTEGKPEIVLIRGRDLWRNPKVYIGSQPAKAVSVMPDMSGLVASFDCIIYPSSVLPGSQLSVITSTNGLVSWKLGTNAESRFMQISYTTTNGTDSVMVVPVPGPQLVDLTVVTSGGSTVLRDGVQVLPDLTPPTSDKSRRWFMSREYGRSRYEQDRLNNGAGRPEITPERPR